MRVYRYIVIAASVRTLPVCHYGIFHVNTVINHVDSGLLEQSGLESSRKKLIRLVNEHKRDRSIAESGKNEHRKRFQHRHNIYTRKRSPTHIQILYWVSKTSLIVLKDNAEVRFNIDEMWKKCINLIDEQSEWNWINKWQWEESKRPYHIHRFNIKYTNATPPYWISCNCTYNTHSETTATAHGHKEKMREQKNYTERNRQGMRISFIVIYSTYTLYLMVLLIFLGLMGNSVSFLSFHLLCVRISLVLFRSTD